MQPVSKLPGVSIWWKHAADTLRMSKAEAIVPNSSVPSPSKTNSTTSKKSKIGGLGVIHSQDAENSCPSSLFSCPTLGPGVAGASLAARPLSSPALSAVADGASNKRNMDQITEQEAARDVRHRPAENAVLPFSPKEIAPKKTFLHLMDATLDQICCEKEDSEIALAWTKQSGGLRDLTEIGINPSAYDASILNALPFNFDDNLLLAVHTVLGIRKHLWFCLASQQLFWLIGSVPDLIQTWRHKMLRRGKYVTSRLAYINSCSAVSGETIFFSKALRFRSNETTIADVLNQNTRFGGPRQNLKQSINVQPGMNPSEPILMGLKAKPTEPARMMGSHERVQNCTHSSVFRMGEGVLDVSAVPETISVSQICESLSALDRTSLPNLYAGKTTLQHAMLDIDNAVFAVSASEIALNPLLSTPKLIDLLRVRLTHRDQGDVTKFVPSGKWQLPLDTGPTVRPVDGGKWWLLNSPSFGAEPVRFWIHSTGWLDMDSLKASSLEIAKRLFKVMDPSSQEQSKLYLTNTQHEVLVPGGYLLPLAISLMACRIARGQTDVPKVTIFWETYGNKSHGMKLDALKSVVEFGSAEWLNNVTDRFALKWKHSVLQTYQKLLEKNESCCFDVIDDLSSIGFGFSTSYADQKRQPLHSVCKQNAWMKISAHESFCVLGLHSEMSTHTTHFKEGLIKRIQAYVEGMNAISDKQCGHGGTNAFHTIGLSALNRVQKNGALNVSALLDGISEEFRLMNDAIVAMKNCPRNRTEIQVQCRFKSDLLDLKCMIGAAVNEVISSTQHWNNAHVLSFASLNASAMVLITRQALTIASDVTKTLADRQQLLDIASGTLKRWKSFKTGRGDGVIGLRHDRKLADFPHLSESLLCHLDTMLPKNSRKFTRFANFRYFYEHEIVRTFDDAFCIAINDRTLQNKKETTAELSNHIMKCAGCGRLHFGDSNKQALQAHFESSPSCQTSKWNEKAPVTSTDWIAAYNCVMEDYSNFLETSSRDQKNACESVLKFGSGLLAIGVAGAGKSVVLNEIGKVLDCIFYKKGEIIRCASTGLLAEDFNDSASTVNKAIGAYPNFGTNPDANWNLSVTEGRDLIVEHRKVTAQMKVFINTEVYAQSSNMLQAMLELRRDKKLTFICILDGDPPQPMHEDDSDDIASNHHLCSIKDHILLNHSAIERLLPEVRIVNFEIPMRQKDAKVQSLSNAVRHAKADKTHVQYMRQNPYIEGKTPVDITLCSLRKDMILVNNTMLAAMKSNAQVFVAIPIEASTPKDVACYALHLKIDAPVLFNKAQTLKISRKTTERDVANGTRGTIVKLEKDKVLVKLLRNNLVVEVVRSLYFKKRVKYEQYPLDLGFSTTIKRAGGMTFNTVAINFGFDWKKTDAELIDNAKQLWRTSQAYGGITRPRNLAYFIDANSFRDPPMLAFLNNQNLQALEFLKSLVKVIETTPYCRSEQEARYLSLESEKVPLLKKPRKPCFELLQMKTKTLPSLGFSSLACAEITSQNVYVSKYPDMFANQAAGHFCKGILMSVGSVASVNVLVKTTHQSYDQANEIRALEALAGIRGIPILIGKICLDKETRLVFEDLGATPNHNHAALSQDQKEDIDRLKNEMKCRGWTLHATNDNIWISSDIKTVTIFNFEAAHFEHAALATSLVPAPASRVVDQELHLVATALHVPAPAPSAPIPVPSSALVTDPAPERVSDAPDPLCSPEVHFSAAKRSKQPAIVKKGSVDSATTTFVVLTKASAPAPNPEPTPAPPSATANAPAIRKQRRHFPTIKTVGAMVDVRTRLACVLRAVNICPQSCYSQVVTNPELLRRYPAFR